VTDRPTSGPPPISVAMLLILAGDTLARRVNDELRPHGLSMRHLGALGHLNRDPQISYTELARRARVTVQSMHKTVAALVELGAVRHPPGGRGRTAALEVTDRGRELIAFGTSVVAGLDAELAAALPSPADGDRLAADLLAILRPAG
jgi:DNA-binding MarR family transcriptional regulator